MYAKKSQPTLGKYEDRTETNQGHPSFHQRCTSLPPSWFSPTVVWSLSRAFQRWNLPQKFGYTDKVQVGFRKTQKQKPNPWKFHLRIRIKMNCCESDENWSTPVSLQKLTLQRTSAISSFFPVRHSSRNHWATLRWGRLGWSFVILLILALAAFCSRNCRVKLCKRWFYHVQFILP